MTDPSLSTSPFPLTDRQREAVEHDDGPLIVLAGPGTGKTRVITERVGHMISSRGIDASSILAITFTNKAAGELRERISGSVGASVAQKIQATTFHSFGLGIIQRFGDVLGLPANPILIDSAQRRRLMRELIQARGLYSFARGAGIDSAIEHAQDTIALLRNAGIDAARAVRWSEQELEKTSGADDQESLARRTEIQRFSEAATLLGHLESECLTRGWMVFDDLIAWPTKLLRQHPSIAAIVRQNQRHLVVDEFQDVNASQIALLEAIAPPTSNPDICVVGDDDQSIYAFRGADDRAFARFDQLWKNTRTITLDDNFRSQPPIVVASNTIIASAPEGSRFNADKIANPMKSDADSSTIELVRLEHDEQAGEAIASMVLQMRAQDADPDLSSIAVIARSASELARIARVLDLSGIPFSIREKRKLLDDQGAQDVIAWARAVVDPFSTPDLRRVLTRPPMRCDPHTVGSLITRWKIEHARNDSDPTEHPDPGAPMEWMLARATGDASAPIVRTKELLDELARINTSAPACETMLEIIKRSAVLHADLADPREQSSRMNAIVALLGFARTRASRFEQPGDLGAMLNYIDDLDPSEQSLGELPEHKVERDDEPTASSGADSIGAVQLLTAHASKGLEFDTVFIPRVCSPHGYPQMAGSDNDELPEGLIDRVGDERDSKQRREAEERRVFYVALTRAERRAVMLAKLPRNGRAVNFATELLNDKQTTVIEHDIRDLTDESQIPDAIAKLEAEFKSRKAIRESFDEIKRRARLRAAKAIDDADLRPQRVEQSEEALRESVRTIALASAIRETGHAPDWAQEHGLGAAAERLVESLKACEPTSDASAPGVSGALRLSYTRINTYLQCPRCYLVRYVLRLPEVEHAASTTGSAVHRALELFYTQWRSADAEGADLPGLDTLEQLTRKSFLQLWPRHQEPDRARLEQAVAQSRTVWTQLHDEDAQILELERDEHISYAHNGHEHSIHAKIDRIDLRPDGGYRVIDYKTGYPKEELLEPKKTDLQMGIYSMALASMFGEDIAGADFEYWLLQDGSRGRIGGDDLDLDKIHKKINKAIEGIHMGHWDKGGRCNGGCDVLDELTELPIPPSDAQTRQNSEEMDAQGASSPADQGTPKS